MPYEFNPLIPDGFQKKSAVTPTDITRVEAEISDLQTTTTDLKQKKVTKFFSANDFLEDNEIAQFQGEDDAVNNLHNGFFYKKNPAFSITPNSDIFAYNVKQKLTIYNFDGTFFEQYYLGEQNIGTSDYSIIGLFDESIFTVRFNPALFVNPSLPATPDGNMIFYPYLNVNGVWDYTNPISVQGGNYYYKGNRINLVPLKAGLLGAEVGADMTSPYYRYLWVSILLSHYQAVFAFPYATNSNKELIALGVSNGLGAFGFQSHLKISSIASTTINVQGVNIIANPPFRQTNTQPAGVTQQEFNALKNYIGTNTSVHDENDLRTAEYSIYYLLNNNFALVSGRCTFKVSTSGSIDPLFQFPFTLPIYAISVQGNSQRSIVQGQVSQNGEVYMSGNYSAGKFFDFCFILPISQN